MSGRLLIWILVGQGPTALAVGAGEVVWICFLSSIIFLFSHPLSGRRPDIDWKTVSKGRETLVNQPINHRIESNFEFVKFLKRGDFPWSVVRRHFSISVIRHHFAWSSSGHVHAKMWIHSDITSSAYYLFGIFKAPFSYFNLRYRCRLLVLVSYICKWWWLPNVNTTNCFERHSKKFWKNQLCHFS